MCIEQDQRGDYVLDTSALAEKLSIPPEYLRCQMRLGLVTSRVGQAMPPSLGTSLALTSTAHGDHLSRGDEHNQAPAEVQGTKIGPHLGPVSLNDLRGGGDVALPVDHGIDLSFGAER